jgi:cytochrome c peroxidase
VLLQLTAMMPGVQAGTDAAEMPAATAAASEEPLLPVPEPPLQDARKVALGHQLFHEPRLSRDNSVMCASCHNLASGGDDDRRVSAGVGGAAGVVNAPTVLNSSLNFRQFWDGRAATLEDQIDGPIESAHEMAIGWPEAVRRLEAIDGYRQSFAELYADGIRPENVKDAIATFERTLVTPDSRFDRYLRGDAAAITDDERRGYELFKTYGCASCHQGAAVGGNMYERMGTVRDYFKDHGPAAGPDLGRYNVTGNALHKSYFKVPGLRNVELTAPYFHNGSAATLDEAVRVMGHYNLGVELASAEVDLIVKFLRTLTGSVEATP